MRLKFKFCVICNKNWKLFIWARLLLNLSDKLNGKGEFINVSTMFMLLSSITSKCNWNVLADESWNLALSESEDAKLSSDFFISTVNFGKTLLLISMEY